MARARGARAQLLVKTEVSYGSSPGGNFEKVPFVSQDLGAEQNLIEAPELGYGRDKIDPIRDVINDAGNIVVPIDLRDFGRWLHFLLGAPDTDATAGLPYTHTWQSGADPLPSFSCEVGYPDIPKYFMNLGVKLNTMEIDFRRSGPAQANLGLIAQGEESATDVTGGGTPTTRTFARFNQFQGSILKDGVALANITSGRIALSNGMEAVETIRSDSKIEGVDEGQFSFTGNITSRFADTTLLDLAIAGTDMELSFRFIRAATESLVFTAHKVFLPRPKRSIQGPGGIEVSYDFQAALDSVEGVMATVQLRNDVAAYA